MKAHRGAPAGSQNKRKELEMVPFFMSCEIMYTVYILHSKTVDRYYIGYTNDIERRLTEHNRIKGKFTDVGIPWILVYSERIASKKEVMNRERFCCLLL
jgi:putative endonuclease